MKHMHISKSELVPSAAGSSSLNKGGAAIEDCVHVEIEVDFEIFGNQSDGSTDDKHTAYI
jgi:hypothetical protein